MNYRQYLRAARKGWWLVLLCIGLTTGAAVYATSLADPVYESKTTLFVSGQASPDINAALASGYLSQQRVLSYAKLVTSDPILDRVRGVAGLPDDAPSVSAEAVDQTVLLNITVRDSTPERARAIAVAYGEVVPDVIDDIEKPRSGGPSPIKATVTEPAKLGTQVEPRPRVNLAVGLMMGLLLGLGAAVLKEILDKTLKSSDDIHEVAPDLVVLGAVHRDNQIQRRPLVTVLDPRSPAAEAYRQIRTNIQFADIDGGLNSFVVTSPLPEDGKSTVSTNLAIALAQSGLSVILVEADLRRPAVADYLGVERAVGLTSVMLGRVSLDEALQDFPPTPGLRVLPSGPLPPNPSELLGSHAMQALVEEMEARADVVLFDTPPLLPVTDAAVLGGMTSGVVLVARADRTERSQLRAAATSLRGASVPCVGIILNAVKTASEGAYKYGYTDEKRPGLERLSEPVIPLDPDAAATQNGAPAVPVHDERAEVPTAPGTAWRPGA